MPDKEKSMLIAVCRGCEEITAASIVHDDEDFEQFARDCLKEGLGIEILPYGPEDPRITLAKCRCPELIGELRAVVEGLKSERDELAELVDIRSTAQDAREWFRSSQLWQMIKAELEIRQAEQRRRCSTLDADVPLRRAQGRCQELNDLLSGAVEAAIVAKLRRSE